MNIDKYTQICSDSRCVTAGSLFVAVKGYAADGHDYIASALEKGAAAIVYEDSAKLQEQVLKAGGEDAFKKVEFLRTDNSRKAVALLADEFYGHPSRKLTLVGITGTNGKTTTVTLLYNLFTRLGHKCGLLSTIANFIGEERSEAVNTTSDPITINRLMARMVEEGCSHCFMEVSSIGLEQDRVAGLHFAAGIFSNLTHDHLDYHKTFSEYLRCKKLFFDNLPADAVAITNVDDKNGMVMMQNTRARVVTYSCRKMADHSCRILEKSFEGMLLKIDGTEIWCPLIGEHNAYNALAIYCAAISTGATKQEALVGLSAVGQVCGRLEVIHAPKGISVVIDYAHTPDALQNVLKALREIAPERTLTCLFGCGGDRDRSKRPEMGAIAATLSDRVIVTSDNSRTEKTCDIIADIKAGISPSQTAKVLSLEDRKEAIRLAILSAKENETILLAGKGHENYQILDREKLHFDEREVVAAVIEEMNR